LPFVARSAFKFFFRKTQDFWFKDRLFDVINDSAFHSIDDYLALRDARSVSGGCDNGCFEIDHP
jgi:hypothetical protein